MSDSDREALEDYYRNAESWSADRTRAIESSRKIAWIVASGAAAIAVLEAIALVLLVPLRTVVPYTLLVDRQTGYVQALKPLEREAIAPDQALVRSFLAQYVIARESFDIDSLRDSYRKVALWSAGEARSSYLRGAQASNPTSMLSTLPRRALMEVQIRSISSLNANVALVRFSTVLSDPGGQPRDAQNWVAVIRYRFSGATMTADDRLLNPLGFQVERYRRDAETIPDDIGGQPGPAATSPNPVAMRPLPRQPNP